jgi:hypothetical protein
MIWLTQSLFLMIGRDPSPYSPDLDLSLTFDRWPLTSRGRPITAPFCHFPENWRNSADPTRIMAGIPDSARRVDQGAMPLGAGPSGQEETDACMRR